MGELRSALRATLEQFHAFREDRPKEEKWELIDGVMIMMAPPSLVHHCIATNIDRLLDARLQVIGLPWRSDREIGVVVEADDQYNPEPDVVVIDAAAEFGKIYADRFYFVAEVLSPNDKSFVLGLKREYYKAHAPCRGMIFARQDAVAAELIVRDGAGWRTAELTDATATITIPDIGTIGTLGALYRHTPLYPVA